MHAMHSNLLNGDFQDVLIIQTKSNFYSNNQLNRKQSVESKLSNNKPPIFKLKLLTQPSELKETDGED